MKVIRKLNPEKKEKIGDRGVKLSNSHETIKKFSENIPTIKRFSENMFVEGLYNKTTSAVIRPIHPYI